MRVLPLSIVCVSNERSSAVEVCAAVSAFFQRTRPPFFTTTVTGLYLKDLMSTVADATGAASVGTGAEAAPLDVALDCAVMSSLLPGEEPPHPATSTAATRAADAAGFTLLHSPPAPGRITQPVMYGFTRSVAVASSSGLSNAPSVIGSPDRSRNTAA